VNSKPLSRDTTALKIVEQTGYRRGRGYILQRLADTLLSLDQLESASKAAEEAQAIRSDLREDNNLALSDMQMVVIRLEQGRLTEPEPLVRAAIDTFERVKLTELGATAHAVLTRILLAQGKVGDAQGAARRALTLSRQTGNRPARFDATLASARVKAASGKANEALQDLQAMLAEVTKFGYLPYQFEARLAIGETEMQSGKSSTGARAWRRWRKTRGVKFFFSSPAKPLPRRRVQADNYFGEWWAL